MPQHNIFLETERLRLIPMSLEFVSGIINNDSTVYFDFDVKKTDEWPEKADIKDILTLIHDSLSRKSVPDGFDAWLFVNKEDNCIIGDGGFKGSPDEEGHIDIGYAIIESQRNRGLAFEAVSALLHWGLRQKEVKAITADCLDNNFPSIKLLSKLGMKEVKRADGMIFYMICKRG